MKSRSDIFVQRELQRSKFTIEQMPDERWKVIPPKITGMVVSGGGARGIVYAGLVEELSKRGAIDDLTHISGASAGAMLASLLAIGISAEDIGIILKELNLHNLMDRESLSLRAKGNRFRDALDIAYMLQIEKHFASLDPAMAFPEDAVRLQKKIQSYRKAIEDEGLVINSIHDLVLLSNDAKQIRKIDSVFDKLFNNGEKFSYSRSSLFAQSVRKFVQSAEASLSRRSRSDSEVELVESSFLESSDEEKFSMPPAEFSVDESSDDGDQEASPADKAIRITFSDLTVLRSILPQDSLIKHLNVVITDQSNQKLVTYNETDFPQASIAEMVQISGAHPLLFIPRKDAEGHSQADGGILNNMPVESLIAQGVSVEEMLCVYTRQDAEFAKRSAVGKKHTQESVSISGRIKDAFIGKSVGGSVEAHGAKVQNWEKKVLNEGAMLYLNSGKITVTSMKLSMEEKEAAIAVAQKQTAKFLDSRVKVFDHPVLAMLYLGLEKHHQTILEGPDSPLAVYALQTKLLFRFQEKIVNLVNNLVLAKAQKLRSVEILNLIAEMREVMHSFEPIVDAMSQEKALVFCLHQVDYVTNGQLDMCLSNIAAGKVQDEKGNRLGSQTKEMARAMKTKLHSYHDDFLEAQDSPPIKKGYYKIGFLNKLRPHAAVDEAVKVQEEKMHTFKK